MTVTLHHGDCLEVMARLIAEGAQIDSCVTDPPYHLSSIVKRFGGKGAAAAQHGTDGLYARASAGFMGKQWDGGDIAFRPETWRLVFEMMKPGAHLFAFSGTRTYHRMACAIEDAGFLIRDQFAWVYGSGFPKSHDISKAIDRAAGAERKIVGEKRAGLARKARAGGEIVGAESFEHLRRATITEAATDEATEWSGWGTAVKPAWEPICLGQKPVEGTIAGNVLKYGTGGLNIDGCRIENPDFDPAATQRQGSNRQTWEGGTNSGFAQDHIQPTYNRQGRFPANLIHDGSDEVLACFPESISSPPGNIKPSASTQEIYGQFACRSLVGHTDSGSVARFFYTAKADAEDRWGSKHPTVKPVTLIRYLQRLITPPRGTTFDPFAGSGTAGVAAIAEGFDATLVEHEAEYIADIRERIAFYEGEGRHSVASKNRNAVPPKASETPLMNWLERTAAE